MGDMDLQNKDEELKNKEYTIESSNAEFKESSSSGLRKGRAEDSAGDLRDGKVEKRIADLVKYLEKYAEKGICIAFSGGVDSSLLLKAAVIAAGKYKKFVLAVTFHTRLHPSADLLLTKKLANQMNAFYKVIEVNEFEDKRICQNPVDRCYLCKHLLFTKLKEYASELNCEYVFDGTNLDDKSQYRPGMRALKELSVKSPLMELEYTKAMVREMAEFLELPVYNRPSAPCLATRLPYGTAFDFDVLEKISRAEDYLRDLGFYNIRVRLHGDIARIEVDRQDIEKLTQYSRAITEKLKGMGFQYITLDLEGFRSGSMDIGLAIGSVYGQT